MDELYGNAWGDSSSLAEALQLPQPTWTTPKLATHDDEADLAAPSWSTGAGIQWNEPSEESHGFKWSANEPDLAWAPETVYSDIQISRSVSNETQPEDELSLPTSNDSDAEGERREENMAAGFRSVDDNQPASPALDEHVTARSSTPLSRSSSPDGFGTFETGIEEDIKPLHTSMEQDLKDGAWSSPWVGTGTAEEEQEEQKVDEWEAARRQKERLDRKIVSQTCTVMFIHYLSSRL